MPSFTLVPILSLLSFLASISGACAGIQHHPASALGLRNHRNALRAMNATRASENALSGLQKRVAGEFTIFTPGEYVLALLSYICDCEWRVRHDS